MALLARNDGHPKLAFQLLVYPCTAPEPETPSHRKFADGYLLTRNNIVWFYKQYLRNQRDIQDFRFAPLLADDLSGLPPALVLVAGYDPLRDDGVDYAKRLVEAGNRVTLTNYEGMVHGFLLAGGVLDAAKRAVSQSATALRVAFKEAAAKEATAA
jgi:acetyl esterase